ncbi:MAG TPA: beta-aspartyl-peptidase [Clostridia bacterium]|jgi:beta-aspartyl-dipeptidase (metallo-type)|nr:beta-aspartyl-peptidase [Clostridia bacterium]HPY44047.1 beta-aspartyl-peptidase [Clostridia bacterium]HQA97907.1 beta-aspartyl-peptidase [Clostridia bacterium]HQO56092.1 beta-aspartyl-peptidase [Clostridia bacterium]HUM61581.1 beta-aspartyl-peptidase [Clostridia bacterium]
MLKLLMNCDVYSPDHLGLCDMLLGGGKILALSPSLKHLGSLSEMQKKDMNGRIVCPGLVDVHAHITGGGGEMGPASRMPELRFEDFIHNGVTTVLGLLGTDGISRSLENLIFKARALQQQGLTVLVLTGHYSYPSTTLTGSVQRDIALIEQCIGVKIAVSDHRGSNINPLELARLASDARVSGMLAGKPGITMAHLGSSKRMMTPLLDALELSDVPACNFVPTHCERSPDLVLQAARFTRMGGNADFTADDEGGGQGSAGAIMQALSAGADKSRLTVSSDAGGSLPVFDKSGQCTGMEQATSSSLLAELRRLVNLHGLGLEDALPFFTANPARLLGLEGKKGALAAGADADILVLNDELRIQSLYLGGTRQF